MTNSVESRTVKFTVKLENDKDKDFHWKVEGDGFLPEHLEDGIAEGVKRINGTEVIPIIVKDDISITGLTSLRMVIRESGPSGTIVATSTDVAVNITTALPGV